MAGDGNDSGYGQSDEVTIAETPDELLASDDSGLCAGLLDVLALLSDAGAARWVLHRAGDLALAAAPGGYGHHEVFASEVVDAAVAELAEAGLLTIEEAAFDEADDAGSDDETDGDADNLDDSNLDDLEAEEEDEVYLEDSAFDTVTVAPGTARIIIARHVAAGTIAELGDRVCGLLEEVAQSSVGIDSGLLTEGMTACWDHLRPHLGQADSELVKDLLTMRTDGLYSLVQYPDAAAADLIEFGEKLIADYEQVLGRGHSDAWEARRNMALVFGRIRRFDEAIDIFARLRTDMERVLPADDRGILVARKDLALAYVNAGRYPEAISLYTQLVADYERVTGPEHSTTLHARAALGEAYLEAGQTAEGTELIEAATARLEPMFGPGYPEVIRLREAVEEARTERRMAL
jgi:tetratricopeptide (TPR) repeat protein